MTPAIAITIVASQFAEQSAQLAQQLRLPLAAQADFLLFYDDSGLQLLSAQSKKPISVDFTHEPLQHRLQGNAAQQEAIVRAVGLHKNSHRVVFDFTAGMGRDSFILASMGATVYLWERNEIVAALLQDGLQRLPKIAGAMTFVHAGDVTDFFCQQIFHIKPDVIYLDPMYPSRNKNAKVKKAMSYLQQLVGDDLDAEKLFVLAKSLKPQRIVVKRHKGSRCISNEKPNFVISGKSTRFDIYQLNS